MKKLICLILLGWIVSINAQGITNTLGGNTSADKFIVENSNSEVGLVVTGEGNLGIGTTTPQVRLEIFDTLPSLRLNGNPTSSPWQILVNDYGLTFYREIGGGHDLKIDNSGNVLMPNGNVGIGTFNPLTKLHISSPSVEIFRLQGTGGANPMVTFYKDATSAAYMQACNTDFYVVNRQSGNLVFGTNNSTNLTINNSGQVGIQTTDSGAGLDVNTDVILGVSGTRFMEIQEITGTTGVSGHYTYHADKLPVGWIGEKTRLLSLEIRSGNVSCNWISMGYIVSNRGIAGILDHDGRDFWVYHPENSAFHSRPWRAMIMRMP